MLPHAGFSLILTGFYSIDVQKAFWGSVCGSTCSFICAGLSSSVVTSASLGLNVGEGGAACECWWRTKKS